MQFSALQQARDAASLCFIHLASHPKETHTPVATASRLAFGEGDMSRCVTPTRRDAASPCAARPLTTSLTRHILPNSETPNSESNHRAAVEIREAPLPTIGVKGTTGPDFLQSLLGLHSLRRDVAADGQIAEFGRALERAAVDARVRQLLRGDCLARPVVEDDDSAGVAEERLLRAVTRRMRPSPRRRSRRIRRRAVFSCYSSLVVAIFTTSAPLIHDLCAQLLMLNSE